MLVVAVVELEVVVDQVQEVLVVVELVVDLILQEEQDQLTLVVVEVELVVDLVVLLGQMVVQVS
jgi:hypothetical protein